MASCGGFNFEHANDYCVGRVEAASRRKDRPLRACRTRSMDTQRRRAAPRSTQAEASSARPVADACSPAAASRFERSRPLARAPPPCAYAVDQTRTQKVRHSQYGSFITMPAHFRHELRLTVQIGISTPPTSASGIGYLLSKNPERHQTFSLPFGTAHVPYPAAPTERCSVTLLVDVDPVGLVRGRGEVDGPLTQYVNDRPFAASSFLAVAVDLVFRSTMAETSTARSDLRTLCINTGCVFGGKLTALRYPERELPCIPAQRLYYEPVRPIASETHSSATAREAGMLDIEDVLGKRLIKSRPRPQRDHSRRKRARRAESDDPVCGGSKLVHLPPAHHDAACLGRRGRAAGAPRRLSTTTATRASPGFCAKKNHGSRAEIVLCRSEAVAKRRFGISGEGCGVVYTRTGRRFFNDSAMQSQLIDALEQTSSAPGSGRSWPANGSHSKWSCCPGQPKQKTCCAGNMPRRGPLRAPHCRQRNPGSRRRRLATSLWTACLS